MEPMFDAGTSLTAYEQASLELQQANLELQQANLELQQASLELQQTGLGLQRTSLELQQTGLELQQASVDATLAGNEIALWVGITQAAVALLVGLIQAGVVGWGIRYMIRMGERREQQHADRHTEAMEALRLQATASSEQHAATLEALRQQGDALRTLIERTAPARP